MLEEPIFQKYSEWWWDLGSSSMTQKQNAKSSNGKIQSLSQKFEY
jgi:hypothetical protein